MALLRSAAKSAIWSLSEDKWTFDQADGSASRRGVSNVRLQNNTQVADGLIAFQQIDLLGRYFPAAAAAHDAVAGPAG